MPVKLRSPLHSLNPSPTIARSHHPMKLRSPSHASFLPPIFSRVFPFRLRYRLCSGKPGFHRFPYGEVGIRRLSTRPRLGLGRVLASKSLIDDEAGLGDWVSELNPVSFGDDSDWGSSRETGRGNLGGSRGRPRPGTRSPTGSNPNLSREDSGFGSDRGKSREMGRGRDSGLKRQRDSDVGSKRNSSRDFDRLSQNSRGNVWGSVVKRRFDKDLDDVNGKKHDFRGLNSANEKKARRSGRHEIKNDELMDSFKGLLSEEGSDDDDNGDLGDDLKNAKPLPGSITAPQVSSPAGSENYLSESRFDQCSVSPLSLKGIKNAGYEKMTIVQEATLPVILQGKDVLAKARTGTGKTVAFLLPSIEVIVNSPPVGHDQKRPPIMVLVICPTRELASQAAKEADMLLRYHASIGVQVVIGGTRLAIEQKRIQANPCQILVATPGRLRDHIENTAGFATRLMGVKVLVLDEADHLLGMGFRKEIEKIIAAVPKQRQTLLFSATVPTEVRQICHIALKRDHEFINTVEEGSEDTHSQVKQMHLVATLDKHFSLVYALLKEHISDDVDYKVLVFCTTAMVTRLVADLLGKLNLNVREIHSRKPQNYRTRVSDEFRKSKGLILVTSDVSARGVDYPDVTLVIQVGLPADRQQYIHRLGRTGRKGKEGQGILLLAPWEEFFLSTIKDLPLTKAPAPLVDPDTVKQVGHALSNVEMKNKEAAYQAWLGYYNSNKNVGRDKSRLVELANDFSRSMGLANPPTISKLVLGKMGLRNVPGLRSK